MSQGPGAPTPTQTAAPLLLCEALGFSPQLLLDDIINIANNAVQDGVNGMEEFLQKWADERVAKGESSQANIESTTQEVEQGLVAFQTLLEHHTDIAFDFFEAWCLRNIFMIPQDLPIVLPHQEKLDLTVTPEREQELMDEVEELRKGLDASRKLNRTLSRAVRAASRQQVQAEARLSRLTALASPQVDTLVQLAPQLTDMYQTLSNLPPHEIPASVNLTEPGKRQWETNKTGYMNWALGRLLAKGSGGEGDGKTAVDKLDFVATEIGTSDDLSTAMKSLEEGAVNVEYEDADSRMMEE